MRSGISATENHEEIARRFSRKLFDRVRVQKRQRAEKQYPAP
jgi:hypothetical protein